MTVTTYKWSLEQWHKLIETGVLNGQNVEFIEGEIITISPEGIPHSFSNRRLGDYLRELFKGIAYCSERYPITLNNSEPQPDFALLKLPADIYRNHHPYPEDIYLLIEISNSTLKFDREIKAKIYARNRIAEYWIVDLANHKLIVHTSPKGDTYQTIKEYQSGTISCFTFPEIEIALEKLLLF